MNPNSHAPTSGIFAAVVFQPRSRRRLKKLLGLACLLVALGLPAVSPSDASAAPDPSTDLVNAVRKMNLWLAGDAQAEGWRRYLMLNALETQSARGPRADLATLKRIHDLFASEVAGLEHPRFARVREQLARQIENLQSAREAELSQLLATADQRYTPVSIERMRRHRDFAADQLDQLKAYYQQTLPAEERAAFFEALEFNAMIDVLESVQFTLPPDVSVGKLTSQLRDLQEQRRTIVEQIDAIPTRPEPDADPQEVEQRKKRLEQLQQQRDDLDQKIEAVEMRRTEVAAADRPRRQQRAVTGRELVRLLEKFVPLRKDHADPYFDSAQLAYEQFVNTYSYGTDDNLEEKFLARLGALREAIGELDGDDPRAAAGNVGDNLKWLENANQLPHLVTAVRANYSLPNAIVSVSGQLINRIASQPVQDTQPVEQSVKGRVARGCATTQGSVTIDLMNDPNQVHASIHLLGGVHSDTYVSVGPLQVFAGADGGIEARRSVYGNVGGLFANPPYLAANFQAQFQGTSSRLKLINRIANKQFEKSRCEAQGQAAWQAEEKLRNQFLEQTEKPLSEGRQRLAQAQEDSRGQAGNIPPVYVRSTSDRIFAVARKDTIATIAARSEPQDLPLDPEISVRVHESLASNFLDKTFAGRTFTDSELAAEIADVLGEAPAGLTGQPTEDGQEPEPFSITFARVRPIQVEFDDQGFSVAVSGRQFSQGNNAINEPLNIILRFRIVQVDGGLKLMRNGPIDFSYPDPTQTTPKIVAFRSFLDSRLNKEVAADETSQDLPDNLLPIDRVEALQDSPIAKRLRLVQFRSEQGWLYLGWNLPPETGAYSLPSDLPGIWNELPPAATTGTEESSEP